MIRRAIVLAFLLSSVVCGISGQKHPPYPSFEYDDALSHEIKPHRRTIPLEGVLPGFNQLRLTLVVSPSGDVVNAEVSAEKAMLKFWPQLKSEVYQWKFTPFEKNGGAVTAEVEEYIDLVPPERLPKNHAAAPVLRQDSNVTITLERTGCYGSCPSYTVTVSTSGIVFDGRGYVVAAGRHIEPVDAYKVRDLAQRFIVADFYSMDAEYIASVTDNPTYILSIAIDGHEKKVVDYVGEWTGMPAVIHELEDEVDVFAHTKQWIEGVTGVVQQLKAEKFNFHTFEAQVMLKEAARRGEAQTVRAFLDAGVPLDPLAAPKPTESDFAIPFEHVGWLNAASHHLEVLRILINASASNGDQDDKDLALAGAARSGDVDALRALIAYGANPNADLSRQVVTETVPGFVLEMNGAGSILIYAAESGNPAMVRELLLYHPNLESRDWKGETAVFAAGEYSGRVENSARAECVRLLVKAGANVNARDNHGNTPLHESFLSEVEKELLELGADVNARNNDGETPIFTNVDISAIPLFIEHGADLTIRNNKGQTVMEAAKGGGPAREAALRKAIEKEKQH